MTRRMRLPARFATATCSRLPAAGGTTTIAGLTPAAIQPAPAG